MQELVQLLAHMAKPEPKSAQQQQAAQHRCQIKQQIEQHSTTTTALRATAQSWASWTGSVIMAQRWWRNAQENRIQSSDHVQYNQPAQEKLTAGNSSGPTPTATATEATATPATGILY